MSAIPKLRRLHDDSAAIFPVQFLAAGALYKMNDPSGLSLLQRQLTSEYSTMRVGAAEQMASRPDGTWMQVVRALVTDQDPHVRLRAAKLIAPFDLDLARQTLESLLVDNNQAIRQLAGMTIADRTATDFVTLRRLLRTTDMPTRMRAAGRMLELTR
jgi:HEAT repeat protein